MPCCNAELPVSISYLIKISQYLSILNGFPYGVYPLRDTCILYPCVNVSMSNSEATRLRKELLDTPVGEGKNLMSGIGPREERQDTEAERIAEAASRAAYAAAAAVREDAVIAINAARTAGQKVGEQRAAMRIAELEAALTASERHLAAANEDIKVGESQQCRFASRTSS